MMTRHPQNNWPRYCPPAFDSIISISNLDILLESERIAAFKEAEHVLRQIEMILEGRANNAFSSTQLKYIQAYSPF